MAAWNDEKPSAGGPVVEGRKWETFKSRYFSELDADSEAVRRLLDEAAKGRLTLLFSAKDAECNQAVALTEYLLSRSKRGAS